VVERPAGKKKWQRHEPKPPLRITPEHDPAIPPAAFVEQVVPGVWHGSRLLYMGACSTQFAYAKVLRYNCIETDVIDCSRQRCFLLRQTHRWLHDIIHGWYQFLPGYMLPDYDTILWVNGPCSLSKDEAFKVIGYCQALKPHRLVIINELEPPQADPAGPEDRRHSLWTASDLISLGFNARIWLQDRGSVIAWKDCRKASMV